MNHNIYSVRNLLDQLNLERINKYKNGIYYFTQVELAYNSNRIEGSRLKREHTESLFLTKTILANQDEVIRSDDVIETTNHFRAFDYLLDSAQQLLDEEMIKEFHRILKTGTSDADISWFNVGDYKAVGNVVANHETTAPEDVEDAMHDLMDNYDAAAIHSFDQLLQFHVKFERIHPFQDGNGRVGRLIMFRECLKNDIIPFIIDADHKDFYYRGLQEYFHEPGYLRDTCLSAQDNYTVYCKKLVKDFIPKDEIQKIEYTR